jgi:hypothetical protein
MVLRGPLPERVPASYTCARLQRRGGLSSRSARLMVWEPSAAPGIYSSSRS